MRRSGVREQPRQLVRYALAHASARQLYGLGDAWIAPRLGVLHHDQRRGRRELVVARGVDAAVVAEGEVGHEDLPDEGLLAEHAEARARGFDAERPDQALARLIAVVAQEEAAGEALGQPEARVVGEPGRAVREVPDGRHDPGRLRLVLEVPELLGVPRPAHVIADQGLDRHRPARVAALHHVDDARAVPAVAIVVAREEIPVVVEGELLRIAQPLREHLEVAAVGVDAKHRAAPRIHGRHQLPAFARPHVVAAVADREVDLAVGAEREAVHVVAAERGLDAEAGGELFDGGRRLPVDVEQPVQARDLGRVEIALVPEHAREDPVHPVVPARELARRVGHAVAVRRPRARRADRPAS